MHYLVIVGNVGVGKTTTIHCIKNQVPESHVFIERKGHFLQRFYADPSYAFLNQLDYSIQFLEQAVEIASLRSGNWVLQDRSIFDTHGVFSAMFAANGLISSEQFQVLGQLHDLAGRLCCPSILIHLYARPQICLNRLKARGDIEERDVQLSYLKELEDAHRRWFDSFGLCPKMEISTEESDPDQVVRRIMDALP